MTGFGEGASIENDSEIYIEIKSVNHRFLEISIKPNDLNNDLDKFIRNSISKKIKRGKVDIRIRSKSSTKTTYSIDSNLLKKLEKSLSKNLTFYQLCRHFISNFVSIIINTILLDKNIGDTQAGLKGFKKPKNFNRYQFISKKFFLDAELMILFHRSKMQLKSVALKYKMYNESTIKVFALQNFQYLFELLRVIIYYKIVKTNKIIL